jgi:hypothetical protein
MFLLWGLITVRRFFSGFRSISWKLFLRRCSILTVDRHCLEHEGILGLNQHNFCHKTLYPSEIMKKLLDLVLKTAKSVLRNM